MNVLLDECVPARLGRLRVDHFVISVPRRGWAGIKNGELLALAEKEFDVFVTVDKKIPAEQNLAKFGIAVLLIRAPSNRLSELRPLVPQLLEALHNVVPGRATIVAAS